MPARAHVCGLSLVLVLAAGAARADEAGLSLGGFICSRPFAPDCVDAPTSVATAASATSCQSDVDRFVAATAAYRDCLQRQISSAIRRVNDIVDHFHCLSRREACPRSPSPSASGPRLPARAH